MQCAGISSVGSDAPPRLHKRWKQESLHHWSSQGHSGALSLRLSLHVGPSCRAGCTEILLCLL